MRVLTVRQPWAWAIIHRGKDVENRSRNIAGSYRGPVAIHTAMNGASLDDCHRVADILRIDWFDAVTAQLGPLGRIIGVVDLVDVHRVIETGGRRHCETVAAPTASEVSGACSRWAEPDRFHLMLANPRPLAVPIQYKGGLGLRRLPDDVVELVRAGLS